MRPEIPGQQPATDTRAEVQRVVENGRGQQPVQEAIEHRDLTPEEQKERTAMQVRRAIALLVASLVVGGLIALKDGGSYMPTGEDAAEKAAREYILKTWGKKAIRDPNTGAVIVKSSLKRIIRKEQKQGIKNPLICKDICGKEVCAVRTELEAFMRANKKAVADGKGCIKVGYSRRTQAWQCRNHKRARVMKNGKPVCKRYLRGANGKKVCVPKTKYPIAMCGFSFHEPGRAFDVTSWRKHQKYLWDEGFSGGIRGINKDYAHFSRGEFSNKYCRPGLSWKKIKECMKLGGNLLDSTINKLKAKGNKYRRWIRKKSNKKP